MSWFKYSIFNTQLSGEKWAALKCSVSHAQLGAAALVSAAAANKQKTSLLRNLTLLYVKPQLQILFL